jgi:hypothetical protein
VQENGTAYTDPISAPEASKAVETLGNLLFLLAHHSEDSVLVRRFSAEAESCVRKLAQFIRPQLSTSSNGRPNDRA